MIIIAFEGLDGVGKTTLINQLNKMMECIISQELPKRSAKSDNKIVSEYIPIGTEYRERLIDAIGIDKLLIISEARKIHSEMVLQPLYKDHIVIMDRYIESTYAYQGLDYSEDCIQVLENYFWNAPYPDLNILLTGERKIRTDDDAMDKMEASMRERIWQNYAHRREKKPDQWYEIKRDKPPEILAQEIYKKIQLLLINAM